MLIASNVPNGRVTAALLPCLEPSKTRTAGETGTPGMSNTTVTRTPQMISLKAAAQRLGVTEQSIRRYIAAGELNGYRLGRRAIRVDAQEVDALLVPIPTAKVGNGR